MIIILKIYVNVLMMVIMLMLRLLNLMGTDIDYIDAMTLEFALEGRKDI
jgi:recombinational DNA repair protein RecR